MVRAILLFRCCVGILFFYLWHDNVFRRAEQEQSMISRSFLSSPTVILQPMSVWYIDHFSHNQLQLNYTFYTKTQTWAKNSYNYLFLDINFGSDYNNFWFSWLNKTLTSNFLRKKRMIVNSSWLQDRQANCYKWSTSVQHWCVLHMVMVSHGPVKNLQLSKTYPYKIQFHQPCSSPRRLKVNL